MGQLLLKLSKHPFQNDGCQLCISKSNTSSRFYTLHHLLMNLISQWNQSELSFTLNIQSLLPDQSGKLSKNDQKDSKYCVGLKTCEPDLNITNV